MVQPHVVFSEGCLNVGYGILVGGRERFWRLERTDDEEANHCRRSRDDDICGATAKHKLACQTSNYAKPTEVQ